LQQYLPEADVTNHTRRVPLHIKAEDHHAVRSRAISKLTHGSDQVQIRAKSQPGSLKIYAY
jgi:hypothetical protein